ncbi:M48 family metallopeptidase [Streptomyces sp. NPDC058653]|uniref:M48 family metallopeptidase n=1 Tax=Streptomyces sp. NPDC058653 TaxID=3346576 RepID=UPI0036685A19
MTACRPPVLTIRAFPSDLALMLGLLAATVLTGDLFFSLWLADREAPMDCAFGQFMNCPKEAGAMFSGTLKYLALLLGPGPLIYYVATLRSVQRSMPLADAPFTGATPAVRNLVREAGLQREPTVMVDPNARAGAYVTGGFLWPPLLMLGPELLAMREKDEHSHRIFEAVVRHEIAHLRSGDLRSYAVMTALRWSNLLAGAFTAYVLALSPGELGGFPTLVRIVLLITLGELIARAYLRFREYHADLHAGLADRDALMAALDAQGEGTEAKLRSWLRHHPMGGERRGALEVPERILASSRGIVFLGGTTAGVLLATLQDMLLRFYGPRDKFFSPFLCGLLVGLGLTMFLAFTLWRHHWYAGTTSVMRTVSTAVLAAAGLLAGTWTALYTRGSSFGIFGFPLAPSVLTALVVGMLLLCGWLTLLGAQWFRVDPHAERIPRFLRVAVPSACLLGGWLFVVLWTWAVLLRSATLLCSQPGHTCTSAAPELVTAFITGRFGPGPVLVAVVFVALAVPLAIRSWNLRKPRADACECLRT